jgi:F420-dependent methylenetetrahydromethanopterin dehydrogenase
MLRSVLAKQIQVKSEISEPEEEMPIENPFARSESLMALYQREKAKQVYYEQLAIVKQKEGYVQKLAEMERKQALQRLDFSKRE